jgi:hypothetical protein
MYSTKAVVKGIKFTLGYDMLKSELRYSSFGENYDGANNFSRRVEAEDRSQG